MVAHTLRLDYATLKQRLIASSASGASDASRQPAKAAFVELLGTTGPQMSEYGIELESRSGSRMRVQWKTAAPLDWVALLRAWREVEG